MLMKKEEVGHLKKITDMGCLMYPEISISRSEMIVEGRLFQTLPSSTDYLGFFYTRVRSVMSL